MKLILHAGLPKTGSSFLQSFLYHKSNILFDKGIYFPIPDGFKENDIIKAGNAKEICRLMSVLEFDKMIKNLDIIYQEAKQQKCNTILLSQEGFYSQFPKLDKDERFKNWIRHKEIESVDIILAVRNPYDFLFSIYKQRCRSGKNLGFDEFLRTTDNLDKMINFFKSEILTQDSNLYLINYDLHKKGLKNQFIKILKKITNQNFTTEELIFSVGKVNRSLTLKEIKFIQSLSKVNSGLANKTSRFLSRFDWFNEDDALKSDFMVKAKDIHKSKINSIVERFNRYWDESEKMSIK